MFAVVVTIEAVEGKTEDLKVALENNASHSRTESGCLKWEWSQHVDDPQCFAIYELYTDREAFLTHKGSEHFANWVTESTPCIEGKVAGQYDVKGADPRPMPA